MNAISLQRVRTASYTSSVMKIVMPSGINDWNPGMSLYV